MEVQMLTEEEKELIRLVRLHPELAHQALAILTQKEPPDEEVGQQSGTP